jgi:hypothetical protein
VADEEKASGQDDGRPAFARDFPRVPALDALVTAFSAGDFARVRAEAAQVMASSTDDGVKRAVETLVTRTKPDPIAALLVAFAAVLLIALSAWWITHDGPR